MNFSTNQNRHLFVIKRVRGASEELNTVGDIKVKQINSKEGCEPEIQFFYKGPGNNGIIKSPVVPLKNLSYAKIVAAADQRTKLKKIKVSLDPNVNSGAPVAGQDYILRIELRQFYGMSDEDQYFKDAVVHATAGMSASTFFDKMVDSLNLCFSREVGATSTSNPYLSFSKSSSTTVVGGDSVTTYFLLIEEKPQDYIRGVASKERVLFDVFPTTIYVAGDDVVWAKKTNGKYYEDLTASNSNVIKNGAAIADLEYFCLGERGDQYRMMGWPNIVPTEYQVDPTAEYDTLELHFAFTDTGVNSYRSEKDITFVADSTTTQEVTPSGSDTAVDKQIVDVLADNIASVTGSKLNITRSKTYE